MIVILNMQSDSAALSDYIIDELIANAVNDKIFKVVDRQQLDLIRFIDIWNDIGYISLKETEERSKANAYKRSRNTYLWRFKST